MEPATNYRFSKIHRLNGRKTIQELMATGNSFFYYPFRIIYKQTNEDTPFRICISVSKRNFKKAVDRNKIKRRTRESIRLMHQELSLALKNKKMGMDVMFIYTAKKSEEYSKILDVIMVILKRLKGNITN